VKVEVDVEWTWNCVKVEVEMEMEVNSNLLLTYYLAKSICLVHYLIHLYLFLF
jgi:hypothetical protein